MRDLDRKGNEAAMNASIEWARKEAAKQPAVIPDNAVLRNGVVVGKDQRVGQLRSVCPADSK